MIGSRKIAIPNKQMPNKSQYLKIQVPNHLGFSVWVFEIDVWALFDIWDLPFGTS
jgi:hypothetical protein